jgi:DNA invertase Pin-like site-specific DNA recombinase
MPVASPVAPLRGVIGYIRVSTEEQQLSVEAQQQALEDWCQAHAVALTKMYTDCAVSGGTPLEKRPGLLMALSALTRGSGLLVVRRDRLAHKKGAVILTVAGAGDGEGPEAQPMRTMIDAFAPYERALIVLRTKAGLARKWAKGERIGEVPYGWQPTADGVHLREDPTEQAVIATVRALRASGLSYRAIAAAVNQRGLTNRAGGPFHKTQVIRMLDTR